MKDTILQNLKKYNYNFQLEGKHKIRVKLGLNLDVMLEISEDKVSFSSQLVPWNPLTGIIETSLQGFVKAFLFWMLAISLLYIPMASIFFDTNVLLYNIAILIGSFSYICIVGSYFFISYESFKTKVMLWLK